MGGGSWSGEGLVTSLGVGGDVGYVGCENPTYPISRVDVYKELKFLWKCKKEVGGGGVWCGGPVREGGGHGGCVLRIEFFCENAKRSRSGGAGWGWGGRGGVGSKVVGRG